MEVLDSAAKCLRYTSKKSAFDWNTTLSKSHFFYVIRVFLNEEKFSDFNQFTAQRHYLIEFINIYKMSVVWNII